MMGTKAFHEAAIQQWILQHGSREEIIEWLIWNDGNGIYTDADSEAEGYAPLTLERGRELMRQILERD
jgi:neutral trehalase